MMKKNICDICNKKEVTREYRIKTRKKGKYVSTGHGFRWNSGIWTDWKEIDICGECAEKFFNLPYLNDDGLRRPPAPKC